MALDAWLALADLPALRRELRWLRRRAAGVRDLDVKLGQDPPPRLALRWRRRRARSHRVLAAALDGPRCALLLVALAAQPPLTGEQARRGVRRLARRVLALSLAEAQPPRDLDALHRLRRRLRRLRYGLAWVGESAPSLEPLLESLGRVCDARLARRGGRHPSRRVRDYRRALRRRQRRDLRRARRRWKRARRELEALR